MTHILDNKWQNWIKDNFQRGCSKASMLNVMLEAGIEEEIAQFNLTLYEAGIQPNANTVPTNHAQTRSKNKQAASSYLFQHENKLQTSDGQTMQVIMRCTAPDVVLLDHFMTAQECDELCELSKDSLTKSTVVDDATGEGVNHAARTSLGTYFNRGENPLVEKLENRISEMTALPVENGEGIQILNYADGGEYKPHFDYFPENEGGKANMSSGGQRIVTIVMYLNDVTTGGATTFPEINLSVYPKKGMALYFSYFNEAGQVDPLTLHGGAPVIEGEKWIATKWIRQSTY